MQYGGQARQSGTYQLLRAPSPGPAVGRTGATGDADGVVQLMPGAGEAAARRAARFGTVDYVDGTVTRLGWADLPGSLRSAAESALGAGVIADATQSGGFSPGLASRLVLADGRRVFAKAVSAARNPQSLDLYRREISVMRTLPAAAPAPQLQWSYEDGYWVMLNPLPPGAHTISIHAKSVFAGGSSFVVDVTYNLEVAPNGSH